jgi:hypothetical protein
MELEPYRQINLGVGSDPAPSTFTVFSRALGDYLLPPLPTPQACQQWRRLFPLARSFTAPGLFHFLWRPHAETHPNREQSSPASAS